MRCTFLLLQVDGETYKVTVMLYPYDEDGGAAYRSHSNMSRRNTDMGETGLTLRLFD
jgi:hypothetical protein